VGGGMGFALAIASFFRANVRLATGTGCFVCFLTMLALSFAFVRYVSYTHRAQTEHSHHDVC
jgi:hydrogenase maturation factor